MSTDVGNKVFPVLGGTLETFGRHLLLKGKTTYAVSKGDPFLRKAIAEFWKKEKNVEYNPDKEIIVCESNSLRTCVEPGLFVVMREIGVNRIKKSCKEVIKYADLILDFGSSTDSKKMIYLNDSKWKLSNALKSYDA